MPLKYEALAELDAERLKFSSDKTRMRELCDHLVEKGVYPSVSKLGVPALKMVENYGAWWHEYAEPLACPSCKADLRDLEGGPPGKRQIGVVCNDRIHHWECPDCHGSFS